MTDLQLIELIEVIDSNRATDVRGNYLHIEDKVVYTLKGEYNLSIGEIKKISGEIVTISPDSGGVDFELHSKEILLQTEE